MAAVARIEPVDHEARLRAGAFADSPYGSLMGRGPRTFKKKPVLVLDADELQQAHLAIAMGGAQIMEDAGEPQPAARQRPPAMLLGLAPIGADEDWQPPVFVPKADDDYAFADEQADVWEALPEPEPEPEAADDFAGWDAVAEPPVAEPPAALVEDDDWAAPLASIEEQLARMRELTQTREQAAAPEVPFAPEPEPEPEPRFEPEPVAHYVPEPEPEPELTFAPIPAMEEPVFELPFEAAMVEEPTAVQPEPVFEPAPEPAFEPEDDHYHDGPDLSWMQPKERRQMVFSESSQSQLRARLVQHVPEPEPEAPPSLWDRLRDWFARLRG